MDPSQMSAEQQAQQAAALQQQQMMMQMMAQQQHEQAQAIAQQQAVGKLSDDVSQRRSHPQTHLTSSMLSCEQSLGLSPSIRDFMLPKR